MNQLSTKRQQKPAERNSSLNEAAGKTRKNGKQKQKKKAISHDASVAVSRLKTKYDRRLSRYLAQLLDPWADLHAKIPDWGSYPSSSVAIKQSFQISTGTINATIPPNDAQDKFAVVLRDGLSTFRSHSRSDPTQLIHYEGTGAGGPVGWSLGDTSGTWFGVSEQAAIKAAFTAYRPVALGLKWSYTGPPLSASGRIVAALWPPTLPLPSPSNPITFSELVDFEGAQIFPAIEGGTIIWKPFGLSGVSSWRPTFNGDIMAGIYATNSWDMDPQCRTALQVAQMLNNIAVITAAQRDTMFQTVGFYQTGSSSPCLVVLGEGLPANLSCLNFDASFIIEAISDNRTFSLSQATAETPINDEANHVNHMVQQVPASHSGGSTEDHHNWIQSVEGTIKDVGSAIGTAIDVAGTLATFLAL